MHIGVFRMPAEGNRMAEIMPGNDKPDGQEGKRRDAIENALQKGAARYRFHALCGSLHQPSGPVASVDRKANLKVLIYG
jgi:hypothetical protein